jgi:hypothetical protein
MCWAAEAGTPWLASPVDNVDRSVPASPAIISEVNTPIDSAVPEFWKVDRMPEAAPRWRAGTAPFMVDISTAAVVFDSATHLYRPSGAPSRGLASGCPVKPPALVSASPRPLITGMKFWNHRPI